MENQGESGFDCEDAGGHVAETLLLLRGGDDDDSDEVEEEAIDDAQQLRMITFPAAGRRY